MQEEANCAKGTTAFVLTATALLSWWSLGGVTQLPIDADDASYLENSSRISKSFLQILSPELYFAGRPFTQFLFFLGFKTWGEDIAAFHLLTIAVHTVASVLLAVIASRLRLQPQVALAAGVLFFLQAGHFRAVHWVSALAYPLAFVLVAVSLLCFAEHLRRPSWRWLGTTCLAVILAVLSHVAAVAVLPVSFLLARQHYGNVRQALPSMLPLCGLAIITVLALVIFYPESPQVVQALEETAAIASAFYVLTLLGRLVTTAHWFFVPPYESQPWEILTGLVFLCVLIGVFRHVAELRLWVVWIVAATVLFATSSPEVASRYLYLPSAGISVLFAWCLERAASRLSAFTGGRHRLWLMGIFTVGLLIATSLSLRRSLAYSHYLAARNHAYIQDFRTAEKHFRLAIEKGSGIIDLEETYSRLCLVIMDQVDKVDSVLSEALQLFPDSSHLLSYRAAVNRFAEDSTKIAQSQRTLDMLKSKNDPAFNAALGSAFHNIGLGFESDSKLELAIQSFEIALEFDRSRLQTLKLLASSLVAGGRAEEAVQIARKLVRLMPTEVESLHHAADILSDTGRIDDAIALVKRALELETKADLFGLLAYCYAKKGSNEDAIAYYQLALEQSPSDTLFLTNLGLILQFQGRIDEAIAAYERVTADSPNSVAQFNLGLIYLAQGRAKEARQAYAQGMERFGAAEAARLGTVRDLKKLVTNGVQTAVASELLNTYWPEQ